MTKRLVIVESPTKAKTIRKFLGKGYIVEASNGHIRELPSKKSESPSKYKDLKWDGNWGVDVNNDFAPIYVVSKNKKTQVKKLKDLLKQADELYLATDEDREGESISWHLLEVLKPKVPFKRLVFHEITKEAIKHSLDNPREVDTNLVNAQEARRVLDRLYGFGVSAVLWKKIARGLSAGRVQSVGMRLLVEREHERMSFVRSQFYGMKGIFENSGIDFEAEAIKVGNQKIATGKDFDPATGKLLDGSKALVLNRESAGEVEKRIKDQQATISSVEQKPYTKKPLPPFVTSTLQQEANKKFRYAALRTMSIAQGLYENGYITYMRTDSTTLSDQALKASRGLIEQYYGKEYLSESVRVYTSKVKNAQEAHEAIRPAGEQFVHPSEVASKMGPDAGKLYDLIWKRTVACQMADAKGMRTVINIEKGDVTFRASGKTVEFPGFLRAYVEGEENPETALEDQDKILPSVKKGNDVKTVSLLSQERSTLPPARYTEGSLIKELEEKGIGRPSTWATIVNVILSKNYAFKKGNSLVPTFTAFAVLQLLQSHFNKLVDYEFTARLEEDLDAISRGEAKSESYLSNFYFGSDEIPGLKELLSSSDEQIDARKVCALEIGKDDSGNEIEVRVGRYGPFVSCGEGRASIPLEIEPDTLTPEMALEYIENSSKEPDTIGTDPETGKSIYVKSGRYGQYLQIGTDEDIPEGKKVPRRASLLRGMDVESIDEETALKLFSLPRELGVLESTGEVVRAYNGPYGPYLKSGTETRSLGDISPIEVTLEEAIELYNQPKKSGRRTAAKPLKELGEDPDTKKKIVIKNGRYGPYVTDGKTNASIPKSYNVDDLSLEEAASLLETKRNS